MGIQTIASGPHAASETAVRPTFWSQTLRGVLFALVLVSLFCSGASSLVYQVAWFRELGTIFGVTVQATSAVLASFMGGLALGSLLAARVVGKIRNPFLLYGCIELGIGLTGFASLSALAALQPLTRTLVMDVASNPTAIGVLRFVLAFAVLLMPTTLMGATLPVIISAPMLKEREHGATISLIYAANTFGAIAGALSAGFYFIGVYGITITVIIAACFNTSVGLTWLILAGYTRREARDIAEAAPATTERPYSSRLAWMVIVSYALSGAVALAYEVVWTRLLSGIFPGSVYAFAVMLGAILAGIAVGSWISTPVMSRRWNWPLIYVALQLGMALLAVFSLVAISQAYPIEAAFRARFVPGADYLLTEPWYMALFSLLCLGPAALLMGITFPVAARIVTTGRRDVGERLGLIYGANVLGGIAGSLAGGLIMVPLLGAQGALGALAVGNGIAGALVALMLPFSWLRRGGRVLARAVTMLLVVAVPATATLLPGDYYQTLYAHNPRGEELLWYREGPDVTVQIYRDATGARALRINNLEQGSDAIGPLQFHYRLGHLPMLLHPNPKQILMIGLGLGATAGAIATHADSTMTLVELHHAVVEAAERFSDANYDVLTRPNVHLEVNDGRNYLLMTQRKFDIIETDPIFPTSAGASFLYSEDYFRLARERLNDGGYVVQWIDPDLPDTLYRLVLRTFLSVFPDATLWQQGAILIGSNRPVEINERQIEQKFADPALQPVLEANNLLSVQDVLREYIAGPGELARFAGAGPIITDRQPWIEYFRSQPEGRHLPDFQWMPAARDIAARLEPGDGLVTSTDALNASLTEQAGYTLDQTDAQSAATLAGFATNHHRLWVATTTNKQIPAEAANWLAANTYLVSDDDLGHTRLRLYVVADQPPELTPANVDLSGVARITGWSVADTRVDVGAPVLLALQWAVQRQLPKDLVLDLRLVDGQGRVMSSLRRLPQLPPAAPWQPGATVLDRSGLRVPPGTPAGTYSLELVAQTLTPGEGLRLSSPDQMDGVIRVATITVSDQGRPFSRDAAPAARRTAAAVGPTLTLVGVTLPTAALPSGSTADLALYFQLEHNGAGFPAEIVIGDPAGPAAATITAGDTERRTGAIVRRDALVTLSPALSPGRPTVWLRAPETGMLVPLGTLEIVQR